MLAVHAAAKTVAQLVAQSNPSTSPGDPTLEAIPYQFFDTQTIVSATTTVLNFLAAVNADKTLSNVEGPGQLPAPNWFEINNFTKDYLMRPSDTGSSTTGVLDDICVIENTQRALFTFALNQKPYLVAPLRSLHASGGPLGIIQGTTTADNLTQFALGAVQDGGFYVGSAISIPPNNAYSAAVTFAAAPTLSAGNPNLCISMFGTYHRKIV